MPITTDVRTPIGKVRLLARVTLAPGVSATAAGLFEDADVAAFFELENVQVVENTTTDPITWEFPGVTPAGIKRAASLCVQTVALDETLLLRCIETQGLKTDGAKLMTALLAHAERLRNQADAAEPMVLVYDEADLFDVLPNGVVAFP
jgi:hypothetical protein